MPDPPGSTAGRLAEIQTDYSGLWTCDDPAWRDAFLRDQVPWLIQRAQDGDRLPAELVETHIRAEQAEAAFVAEEDRGDRMRDEAEHWAARCAEVIDERESAEAALAEAMRIQRVQTGQVERVRALHKEYTVKALAPECAREECSHEDECPQDTPYVVCGQCWEMFEEGDPYAFERAAAWDQVIWPCATAAALATPADASGEG